MNNSAITKPPDTVAQLKGLGPRSAAALRDVGIETAAQLRAADPFHLYALLKARHAGTSLNFLYALIGAIEDVHWQDVKAARKGEILLRLEDMGLSPK
jgi:DNA transformation protein